MIPRRALFCCLGAISLACGPEPVAEGELGEVCGMPSPFRVLELPPEQVPASRPRQVGDRVLYIIGQRGEHEPGSLGPIPTDKAVWSTGPCGESPRQLTAEIDIIFTLDAWPDIALGCEWATGDVVALDPTGARPPHVVFAGLGHAISCAETWTTHGALTIEAHDDEFARLILHPYPADPYGEAPAPVVLLDPFRIASIDRPNDVLRTFDDFVLAITFDDTLVRVDLADRTVSTIQEGVFDIETSTDGRYILWQDIAVTGGPAGAPEGEIFLRDQSDNSDIALGAAALAHSLLPLSRIEDGIVQLNFGSAHENGLKRLFFLPGLDFFEAPADLFLNVKLDTDRWIAGRWSDDYYDLLDLSTGEATRLFPRPGQLVGFDPDALEIHEIPTCCIDGDFRDEGPLWRVSLTNAPPQRLARRVTRYMSRLDDDWIVGLIDADDAWLSTLAVIGPDSEQPIDDHVNLRSFDTSRLPDEGILRYSVSDGDRSGVYLAKLPVTETTRSLKSNSQPLDAFTLDIGPGRDRPTPRPLHR